MAASRGIEPFPDPALSRVDQSPDTASRDAPDHGPGRAPLGTSRNLQPLDRRLERFRRRQRSCGWLIGAAREEAGLPRDGGEGWIRPPRPARCRWRVAGRVGVHAEQGRSAHFSGLERCASIWACPVCSAVIRAHRAAEIQQGADRWCSDGGSTLMFTVTLRHRLEDGLKQSLDLLQGAYRRMTGSRPWRALLARHGYVGQIRALEMPWGSLNGWHPHAHVLAFFEGEISDEQIATLEREAFALWESAVLREGGRSLIEARGLKVSRGAAAYIAKVQEHEQKWLAGAELARFDVKRGRSGSLTPFELLDGPDLWRRALWVEYVTVTKGRRAIFWSKGLRDLVGVGDEVEDGAVIAETETAALVFLLKGELYDLMRDDPGALVETLEMAEMVAGGGPDGIIETETGDTGGLETRGRPGQAHPSAGGPRAPVPQGAPAPRTRATGAPPWMRDLGRPEA